MPSMKSPLGAKISPRLHLPASLQCSLLVVSRFLDAAAASWIGPSALERPRSKRNASNYKEQEKETPCVR